MEDVNQTLSPDVNVGGEKVVARFMWEQLQSIFRPRPPMMLLSIAPTASSAPEKNKGDENFHQTSPSARRVQ